MPLSAEQSYFLHLVRVGIGNESPGDSCGKGQSCSGKVVDMSAIKALAERQELAAVVLDGIDRLEGADGERETSVENEALMTQWSDAVVVNYEYRHELYRRAIAEMAEFYGEHGLKMMVLKGFACSLDWPVPEHRPSGDIDIWMFGRYKEADSLLLNKKGIKVDNSHPHHTVFKWRVFEVENHYDFINYHGSASARQLEKVFKRRGMDDTNSVMLYGGKVYLPSPDLHALFLLRHSVQHFTGANISLRNVLDWAFFVKNHGTEVNWTWLLPLLKRFAMTDFFNCLNAICIEDLDFDPALFPRVQCSKEVKDRVLSDILSPEFEAAEPAQLLPRLVYKIRRWRGNQWKQRMCYKENALVRFFGTLWSHLLKPSSI